MILDLINSDFKQAMRDKNETVLSSLRNLKAELSNLEIAKQKPLTEEDVISAVNKKIKQHNDSIASFKAGAREDLVAREQQQMDVLKKYQPKQLSEEEVKTIVQEVVGKMGGKPEFGKVMGAVMGKVKGLADGNTVSAAVKSALS
ncbi:MAG: GatB/YqeY domain-containing protein [Acidobacteriaceae bacterium]